MPQFEGLAGAWAARLFRVRRGGPVGFGRAGDGTTRICVSPPEPTPVGEGTSSSRDCLRGGRAEPCASEGAHQRGACAGLRLGVWRVAAGSRLSFGLGGRTGPRGGKGCGRAFEVWKGRGLCGVFCGVERGVGWGVVWVRFIGGCHGVARPAPDLRLGSSRRFPKGQTVRGTV